MNQRERILHHMELYGEIDPVTAMSEYGCMRLAARIADLKRAGYPIMTRVAKSKNRFGEDVHYSAYSLGGDGRA